MEYVLDRGHTGLEVIVSSPPCIYHKLGKSQDIIGWQRFLEGMVSKEFAPLQQQYMAVTGSRLSIDNWVAGLVTRLLEITHGQWLYRNCTVHDDVAGALA